MIELKGQAVSLHIQNEILHTLQEWKIKGIALPQLTVILVGEDPASEVYVGHKVKMCEKLGFQSKVLRLNENTQAHELKSVIQTLNENVDIDGILVQLPLPKHLNEREILETISPLKDVDCLTQTNIGAMVVGGSVIQPCTPSGIIEIFKFYQISLQGKKVAVIGRSLIVGTPLVHLLSQQNATVTLYHSKSENLFDEIKQFDIVCVAVGRSEYFKPTDFKKDCILIDVGIHRSADHQLTGDIKKFQSDDAEFELQNSWVKAKTPVPGGVGPTTIAMLMKNTISAAKKRRNI